MSDKPTLPALSQMQASRRNFIQSVCTGVIALLLATQGCAHTSGSVSPSVMSDPLPSWHHTAPKKAIIAFVERVTRMNSPDFVPVPERIATFDNDGTLWAEQPLYVQGLFLIDRVKALRTAAS